MHVRPFRPDDAAALAALSAGCAKGESDFVLNPLWETEDELFAEFRRNAIAPEDHLLVAEGESNGVAGLAGFLEGRDNCIANSARGLLAHRLLLSTEPDNRRLDVKIKVNTYRRKTSDLPVPWNGKVTKRCLFSRVILAG